MRLIAKPKAIHWTYHSRDKMRYWRLSEARVRRIIHSPNRIEEGVAEGTVALMQKTGSAKNPAELWTMIQDKRGVRRVISAWRYPGVTKPRSAAMLQILRREYSDFKGK